MHFNNQELSIPNPRKEGDLRLRYNLVKVFEADARVQEIAFVTPQRGPELLSLFSMAMRDLCEYLAQLHYQSAVASKQKRQRRAVVVMEVIPAKLADKKLSNNDTNREAVIELDPEYSAICDVEIEIEAAFIFIREKLRNMESNLNAVKRSLDATSGFMNSHQNTSLVSALGPSTARFEPEPTIAVDVPFKPSSTSGGYVPTTTTGLVIGKTKY